MTATANDIPLGTLARLQPLAALGEESLRGLLPLCRRRQLPRGQTVAADSEWRGEVVYLLRGEMKLSFNDGGSQLLVGGSGDALAPLGRSGDRPLAGKAITDTELLLVDADKLDIVVTWDQLAAPEAAVGGAADWRTRSGMFAAQNLSEGVLATLPAANIDALLGRFEPVAAKRGEVVVRQGDVGDYYYVIDRGRCLVTREVAGAQVELAELSGGDAFGEEALLSDTTRNATVTMKTDGMLLRLRHADFIELLQEPLLRRIDAREAAARVAAGAVWLDARFAAEYRHDGLPGAINVPLNEIRQAMPLLDTAREYIVYCQSGRRSSAAAFLLSQHGFRACLLEGGLRAWADAKAGGVA
jgi:rhodanese-related sulfurtransferase